jgi:hypothetical protein
MAVGCVGTYRGNRPRRAQGHHVTHEDPEFLQARLAHARRRRDDASPFSPDWDAASEAVDDLMQRLERALQRASANRLVDRPAIFRGMVQPST